MTLSHLSLSPSSNDEHHDIIMAVKHGCILYCGIAFIFKVDRFFKQRKAHVGVKGCCGNEVQIEGMLLMDTRGTTFGRLEVNLHFEDTYFLKASNRGYQQKQNKKIKLSSYHELSSQ